MNMAKEMLLENDKITIFHNIFVYKKNYYFKNSWSGLTSETVHVIADINLWYEIDKKK